MKKEMFDPKLVVKPEGGKDTGRTIIRPEKTKQNWKHFVTSLGQKSPADMLEYTISSMARGSHADPHLRVVEISI